MAIIGEIRKRSGLLLAVIGIAMVSFILGDLLKSSSPNSGNSVNAGEALGEDILIYVFNNKVEEGIDNWQAQNPQGVLNQSTMVQIRNDIWDQYIKELVMENEFEKLRIYSHIMFGIFESNPEAKQEPETTGSQIAYFMHLEAAREALKGSDLFAWSSEPGHQEKLVDL